MNSNERFEDLASRLLDDALDEAERRELGELLVSDGRARRELLLLAAIHQELASSGRALVVKAARVRRVRGRTLRWTAHVGWAAAVAAILVGLSLLSIKPEVSRPEVEAPLPAVSQKQLVSEPQPIASGEKLASAQVPTGDAARQPMEPPTSGDKEPVEVEAPVASQAELASLEMPSEGSGQSLSGGHVAYLDALEGDVELARGKSGAWAQAVAGAPISSGDRLRTKISRARVVFESGSVLYVNHWTTLTISVVGMALTPLVSMAGGELYVEVVPQDRGFTVETPHGRAVDLGTRFAVEARPAGTTVSVLDGRVRASTDAGSAELMANQEVFLARKESLPGRVRVVKELDNRLAAWTARFKSPVAKAPLWRLVDDFEGGMMWREVPGLDIVCELTEQDRRSGRFCLKLVYEARENRPKPYGFAGRAIELQKGDRSIVLHVRPIVWRPDARWMVHLKERDGDVWALSEGSVVKLAQQGWSAIQVDLEPPKGRKFTRTEAAGDGWFEPSSVETILLGIFGRQKGITELHVDDVLILQKQ